MSPVTLLPPVSFRTELSTKTEPLRSYTLNVGNSTEQISISNDSLINNHNEDLLLLKINDGDRPTYRIIDKKMLDDELQQLIKIGKFDTMPNVYNQTV